MQGSYQIELRDEQQTWSNGKAQPMYFTEVTNGMGNTLRSTLFILRVILRIDYLVEETKRSQHNAKELRQSQT